MNAVTISDPDQPAIATICILRIDAVFAIPKARLAATASG